MAVGEGCRRSFLVDDWGWQQVQEDFVAVYWGLPGLSQGWKPKAGEWRAMEQQCWLTGLQH